MTNDELRDAVKLFLSIRKGEWPLRPNYGLSIMTFENLTEDQIAMIISDDIRKYFKMDVDVKVQSIDYNSYKVNIKCYNNGDIIDIDKVMKL